MPVRVLVVGGQGADATTHCEGEEPGQPTPAPGGPLPAEAATNTAEIFQFNTADPDRSFWRSTEHLMKFPRFMSDAVLLPDGNVLVVNGASSGCAQTSAGHVMNAELFITRTEEWRTLAKISRARLYHSTALLLPSGEVVLAGNSLSYNLDNPVHDKTVDIFQPPYLFTPAVLFARTAKDQ